MDVASTIPTDDTPMDDFFAQGNALERGQPVVPVVSDVAEPVVVEEPPAGMERDAQGKFVKKAEAEKAAKPRNDPQARIDQAVARQRDAERRAEDAERRLAAQAQPRQEQPKPQDAAKPAGDAEPQEADFADYRAYVKAQARWEARQEFNERESARVEQVQRQQAEHESRTLDESWKGRLADAREKSPDLIASINPETPLSAPMMHVIKESTVGVQLLKHLSDNQELAQRLSTLHPGLALREMGKLEARLEAATSGPAPVVPTISHAKPPIKPLGTSPVTSAAGPPDDSASVDDHIRYYNSQERKRRA